MPLPTPDSPTVAEFLPSPNHNERQDGEPPDMLLLHYTGMQSGEAALARLCDPVSKVSSHYLVFEDGRIVQMVPEDRRAWHAGIASWEDETDINSRSIGVEIVNPGHEYGYRPFPDAQIAAVIALCSDILARRHFRPDLVLAHSDVAPARKEDPGELFPWDQLAAAGIGHWVPPVPIGDLGGWTIGEEGERVEEIQSMLAVYGYGIEITGIYDTATATVMRAFQRHFRPARVDGIADASTVNTLRDLLAALPEED